MTERNILKTRIQVYSKMVEGLEKQRVENSTDEVLVEFTTQLIDQFNKIIRELKKINSESAETSVKSMGF